LQGRRKSIGQLHRSARREENQGFLLVSFFFVGKRLDAQRSGRIFQNQGAGRSGFFGVQKCGLKRYPRYPGKDRPAYRAKPPTLVPG
jgi:hypothetical protein